MRYPTNSLGPVVAPAILEAGWLVLNELKVNPPGTNDAPWEYVELRGPPNALLTNVYFLSVESDGSKNPGKANLVVNLTYARLGGSGLLVLGATNNPYNITAGTTVVGDERFNQPGGALGNGNRSFLLVSSPQPIVEGADLDAGDNGRLEGLPAGTSLLDSVAFSDGGNNTVFYSPAVLELPHVTPDAALRYPTNQAPSSAGAWIYGDLAGTQGQSLSFDSDAISPAFPPGTLLTPGVSNNTAPFISPLPPLSGVIGDPTNPNVTFTVADAEAPGLNPGVTATSTNQAVVPDANLVLTPGPNGLWTLAINPIGVGYTLITLAASDGSLMGQRPFAYAASALGRPGGLFHTYACDGSAAFAVDTNLMFVGDDENQVIRLYERNASGAPLAGFNFTTNLNLTELYGDGTPKEMDIEGSTRVGNRIFWIGSESNADPGDPHPNRNRVFASDFAAAGTNSQLAFVGLYEHLKEDILAWDANNLHGKGSNYYGLTASAAVGVKPKEEDGSGYNIEGLTMAPGSSDVAYVGFRAPLVPATNRAKALIVVVTNFATLAISGAGPGSTRFGPPVELNLIRRGIRSMEANASNVLIVAGPPGLATEVSPYDFKLFTWTPGGTNRPAERAADLSGLNPEGIVEAPPLPWTSNTVAELISDNGVTLFYGDAIPAKRLSVPAFKKFRSDRVSLGPVVLSRPIIRSLLPYGTQPSISWYSVEDVTYAVQYKTNLQEAAWTDVPGDVTAFDATASKILAPLPAPQRFFRVITR